MVRELSGSSRKEWGEGVRTVSFSRIPAVPWTEDVSKVSIELSRYWRVIVISNQSSLDPLPLGDSRRTGPGIRSYVERSQTTAVRVEGLVVELNELFCKVEGHWSDLLLANGE